MGRYKIEFPYGYISLDESEEEKAYDIYDNSPDAIRIKYCVDIFDDGVSLEGKIEFEDLSGGLSN